MRWRDPSGRERSKTFARATDARAYKAMIEAEASRGELWDRSRGKTPFNEVAAAWLEAKVGLRRSSWACDEGAELSYPDSTLSMSWMIVGAEALSDPVLHRDGLSPLPLLLDQ